MIVPVKLPASSWTDLDAEEEEEAESLAFGDCPSGDCPVFGGKVGGVVGAGLVGACPVGSGGCACCDCPNEPDADPQSTRASNAIAKVRKAILPSDEAGATGFSGRCPWLPRIPTTHANERDRQDPALGRRDCCGFLRRWPEQRAGPLRRQCRFQSKAPQQFPNHRCLPREWRVLRGSYVPSRCRCHLWLCH